MVCEIFTQSFDAFEVIQKFLKIKRKAFSTTASTLWCQIVHMGRIKTSWVIFVKPQPE